MTFSIVGANYESADAVVIGAPFEQSASFKKGCIHAPEQIKSVLDTQIEPFDIRSKTMPAIDYQYGFQMLDYIKDLSQEHMVEAVRAFIAKEERFFVLLGGEHSVSIGAFQALSERYDSSNITIVQIDAHFDLRDNDSDYNEENPSRYAHSTVMRRGHELGYNILPIGVRAMFKDEYDYVVENNISYFGWGQTQPTVCEVIAAIQTDMVYLTIDVDGFDPSVMPGTGAPIPGGLSWEYGRTLIREVMKQKEVIAADITEVSPVEHTGLTEYAAGTLAYEMLSQHSLKNDSSPLD
jgi:agmatinase